MLIKMPVLMLIATALFWPALSYGAENSSIETLQIAQADQAEIEFWQSVKNSKDAAEFEAYLNTYPAGKFAPLAKIRVNKLKAGGSPAENKTINPDKTASITPSLPPSNHECDRLAANPSDPGKTVQGVSIKMLVSDEAINACKSAVENFPDVARFHYQLGRALFKARLYKQALDAFRKTVDMNYPSGMFMLGHMYSYGYGVKKDHTESVKWFRKAVARGHAGAMLSLGSRYVRGEGVARDLAEAEKWFRKVAEKVAFGSKAYIAAFYNLASVLDRRGYTGSDPRAAARYFLTAYKSGFGPAKKVLLERKYYSKLQNDTRRAIQRNLRVAGVFSGKIDGEFGVDTLSAIAALKKIFNAEKTGLEVIVTLADANATCKKSHGSGAVAEEYSSFGKQSHVCICAKSHNWNSEGTRCIAR